MRQSVCTYDTIQISRQSLVELSDQCSGQSDSNDGQTWGSRCWRKWNTSFAIGFQGLSRPPWLFRYFSNLLSSPVRHLCPAQPCSSCWELDSKILKKRGKRRLSDKTTSSQSGWFWPLICMRCRTTINRKVEWVLYPHSSLSLRLFISD